MGLCSESSGICPEKGGGLLPCLWGQGDWAGGFKGQTLGQHPVWKGGLKWSGKQKWHGSQHIQDQQDCCLADSEAGGTGGLLETQGHTVGHSVCVMFTIEQIMMVEFVSTYLILFQYLHWGDAQGKGGPTVSGRMCEMSPETCAWEVGVVTDGCGQETCPTEQRSLTRALEDILINICCC